MGFFTRKSINRNKVTLFINCLIAVASSDDDVKHPAPSEENIIIEETNPIEERVNNMSDQVRGY